MARRFPARRFQMPSYKVLSNTAETNFCQWPLGEWPDRNHALAEFNAIVEKEGLGRFIFVRSPFYPHYILVEHEVVKGRQALFWLRKAGIPMNWKRVLLLLWAVTSVAWFGLVFVFDYPVEKIRDPMVAYKGIFPFAEARAKGLSDEQIAAYLSRHAIFDFGKLALLPPVVLLVAGAGMAWAAGASKRSSSN
jgi:hypothetical protein